MKLVELFKKDSINGPAPIPTWYKFSDVVIVPVKVGLDACCNRGCFKTETFHFKISYCSRCNVNTYCGADW